MFANRSVNHSKNFDIKIPNQLSHCAKRSAIFLLLLKKSNSLEMALYSPHNHSMKEQYL
jgi:hypothetical protein